MFDHIKIHDILEMDYDKPILEEDLKELGFKYQGKYDGGGYYYYDFFDIVEDDVCLLQFAVVNGEYEIELFPYDKRYTKLADLMLTIEALKGEIK